jgi:hypothetical protein
MRPNPDDQVENATSEQQSHLCLGVTRISFTLAGFSLLAGTAFR